MLGFSAPQRQNSGKELSKEQAVIRQVGEQGPLVALLAPRAVSGQRTRAKQSPQASSLDNAPSTCGQMVLSQSGSLSLLPPSVGGADGLHDL